MDRDYTRNIDIYLIITVLLLIFFSFIILYSSAGSGLEFPGELKKQIIYFFVGLLGAMLMLLIDYEYLGKMSKIFYLELASCLTILT